MTTIKDKLNIKGIVDGEMAEVFVKPELKNIVLYNEDYDEFLGSVEVLYETGDSLEKDLHNNVIAFVQYDRDCYMLKG